MTSWEDVTGKPDVFEPSAHTHEMSEVAGLEAHLAAHTENGAVHVQKIAVRPATASMQSYPLGLSVFSFVMADGVVGYPTGAGTVVTMHAGTDRVTQRFTHAASGAGTLREWVRHGHSAAPAADGHWTAWQQVVLDHTAFNGTATGVRRVGTLPNWTEPWELYDQMPDFSAAHVSSSAGIPDAPFGSNAASNGLFFRRNTDSGRRRGFAMAFNATTAANANSVVAFRRWTSNGAEAWRYPTTTTTFAMPLSVELEQEEVEVCINDVTEYLFNKLSESEKKELAAYIKSKPQPAQAE